jgi:hypothetical protein
MSDTSKPAAWAVRAARDAVDWLGIIPRTDHKVDGVAREIERAAPVRELCEALERIGHYCSDEELESGLDVAAIRREAESALRKARE